jgi:outer membrane cobalamin receptor
MIINLIISSYKFHKYNLALILSFLTILSIPSFLFSQENEKSVYEMDFNQLSKLKITTASKSNISIEKIPSTVYIITSNQIFERGYLTLDDALSDLPGFQFRNIQGFNSYIFQRGIPNQNNLTILLIDGVQINELNSGGFYGGGQFNMSNIERIEVIYGPASVEYGTNALTGVINIITKKPDNKKVELNVMSGTFDTYEGDFSFQHSIGENFGYIISGMFKNTDKADLKGLNGDNNWTDLMENFEKDKTLDFKINLKNFTFGTNYMLKSSSMSTLYTKNESLDYGTLWNIRFLNNYLKYQKQFSRHFNLSAVLYNRNSTVLKNSIYSINDTSQVGYYRPNNLTGIENVFNYNINEQTSINAGVNAEVETLAKSPGYSYSNSPSIRPEFPKKPEMVNNFLVSFFAEPRITLFDKLDFSGGIRLDLSSLYGIVLTPRAGAIYNNNNIRIRLSYSEAFRAPKAWDYTDGIGNPDLLPETMKSIESGLSIYAIKNLNINLTAYSSFLENSISKEIIGNSYRWINKGIVNVKGLELNLIYETGNIHSSLSYTLNHSIDALGNPVDEISRNTGNGSITYSFNDKIKINLRASYIGKRNNPVFISAINSRELGPYLIFNGTVCLLDIKGVNIRLISTNIMNSKYYHTSNRFPERYRQPQRMLLVSLGYEI